jgi:hypothetical protein
MPQKTDKVKKLQSWSEISIIQGPSKPCSCILIGAGVVYKDTPNHKPEETYLEASSVRYQTV